MKNIKKIAVAAATITTITASTLAGLGGGISNASAYGNTPISALPGVTQGGGRGLTTYSVIPRVTPETKVTHSFGSKAERTSHITILAKDIEKGKSFVKYSNVAFYNGKKIDIKKTIVDYKLHAGGVGYENLTELSFGKSSIDVAMSTAYDEVSYRDEYFISGTNELIEIPSIYTFGDLDAKQYIKINKNSITGRVMVSDESKIRYDVIGDHYVFSNDSWDASNPLDKRNWISSEVKNSSVSYTFGSLKEDGKVFPTPEILSGIPLENRSAFHSLEYAIPKKTDIMPLGKSVKDEDESGLSNTLKDLNEEYTYNFKHTVLAESNPADYFKSYVVSDQLVDALTLGKITVNEEQSGKDVTEKFDIKITGNDFTATLKNPTDAGFYGKSYIWTVKTKINKNADLTPFMDKTKSSIAFPNTASLKIDNVTQKSNEVKTNVNLKPMSIKKTVDKKVAEVGQEINYDIEVTNPEAIAQSGVVTDDIKDVLNNSEYIKGSLTVDGKAVTEEKDKDNFSLTDGILNGTVNVPAGKKLKISFKVKATKQTEEKDFLTNVAHLNTPKGDTPSEKVETEVPAPLTIKKEVNKSVVKIGEEFEYTLNVNNASSVDQKAIVTDNINAALEYANYQVDSIEIDGVKMTDAVDTDAAEMKDNSLSARVTVKAKSSSKIVFKMKAKKGTGDKKIINIAELNQNSIKTPSNKVETEVPTPETPETTVKEVTEKFVTTTTSVLPNTGAEAVTSSTGGIAVGVATGLGTLMTYLKKRKK